MTKKTFKSGFVALLGQSNVGKSTLLNRLVGEKIAITSNKLQTTRNQIKGVFTNDEMQVIFIDTPGLFEGKSKLDQYMSKASLASLKGVDLVFLMVEPTLPDQQVVKIVDFLKKRSIPVFLLINKVDRIHPNRLLPILDAYRKLGNFSEYLPISAKEGIGMPDLLAALKKHLPVGPHYYQTDQLTDRPEYFLVAELIREQILAYTAQEVPHATAIVVNRMHDYRRGKLQIQATIYVEKEGEKGILIGKKGQMLKQIGIHARQQIESLLGKKVNLRLWVKVQHHWRSDPSFLRQIGYDPKEL